MQALQRLEAYVGNVRGQKLTRSAVAEILRDHKGEDVDELATKFEFGEL